MNTLRNVLTLKLKKQTNQLFVKNLASSSKIDNTSCKSKTSNDKQKDKKTTKKIHLSERSKHQPAHCRRQGDVSVAIVGGGYSTVYTTVLLKQNPAIKEIRLIDTDDSLAGSICDIRHIDTSATVKHYSKGSILDGLRNCDIVALMDETDFTLGSQGPFTQLMWSANYVKSVADCMINSCPRALVAVFARPVTATLPIVCEVFKYSGDWNPNRIIGSAALESTRMAAITADYLGLDAACLWVPMAGGVDSMTTVPLLSRARPFNGFSAEEHCKLVDRLRSIDRDLSASEVKGPTLSSGVAAAKFISTLINGLKGQSISIASAYVQSDVLPGSEYTTSELKFGPNGVEKNYGLPKISAREIALIEHALPLLNKIVDSAMFFVNNGRIQ